MIDKLFLYFKSETAFREALGFKQIKDDSIVFIEDKRAVWTHGHMFGIENSHAKGFFSSVDALPSGEPGDWAIVKNDESWYIYYFDSSENRWIQGEIYNVTVPQEDLSDIYVKKEDIFNFIGNFYDNIYVRKKDVYTPEQWEGTPGSDTPGGGGSGTGGGTYKVDYEINKHSLNPVANYVIHDALKLKVSEAELEQILDKYYTANQIDTKIRLLNEAIGSVSDELDNYYTKQEINAMLGQLDPVGPVVIPTLDETAYQTLLNKFKNYYTKNQIDQELTGLRSLKDKFDSYYKKSEIDQLLYDNYYDKTTANSTFVKRTDINTYIKNYCDSVYVRQDKVYTPAGWGGTTGTDTPDPVNPNPGTGGGSYTVDFELNSGSSNPVANWVIKEALDTKIGTDALEEYLKTSRLATSILGNEQLIENINYPIKQYINGYAYTKQEVDTLLDNIHSLYIKVVDSLDNINPSPGTTYLVQEGDIYVQYIYDETDGWIEIGQYELNARLEDYYTKQEINTRLEALAKAADFYTKTYIDTQFDTILDKFEDYYTKQQIDRDVVKNEDVYTISNGFDVVPGHDTPGSSSGTGSFGPKHIILTESEYAQLSSYEVDAIYFVTEDVIENTTWTFGGTFPVTFTNGDTLDNIGTFPINLA